MLQAARIISSLERKALFFYKQHLESLREQQEQRLPRHVKAPATADDLAATQDVERKLEALVAKLSIAADESSRLDHQRQEESPKAKAAQSAPPATLL